jgi:hypothetical protein
MKALFLSLAVLCLLASGAALAQQRPLTCPSDPRCRTYNPPGGVDMRPGADTRLTGTQPFRSGTAGSGTEPANKVERQGMPQRR